MRLVPELLDLQAQKALLDDIVDVLREAPLVTPHMPRTGKPFSIKMSNCGALGWVSDRAGGYRYVPCRPGTGRRWPDIPARLLEIWQALARCPRSPEACLINHYEGRGRLGLHQDRDEADFTAPIVSVSLGDTAVFRLGGTVRKGPTRSFRLASGDVMVLEGASRLAFHGVDRILAGSSGLLDRHGDIFPHGGRINITMRVATPAL